jgi:hypothetical protein
MNIREAILAEHSKAQSLRIATYIGADKARFAELMKCVLQGEYRVAQRGSWVVSNVAQTHPALIRPYLQRMIDSLTEPGYHEAVKRNIVKVLADIDIPEKYRAQVFDVCITLLQSLEEPIAVKAYAITALQQVCRHHPELKAEVVPLITHLRMMSDAPAILSRAAKTLKYLEKLE